MVKHPFFSWHISFTVKRTNHNFRGRSILLISLVFSFNQILGTIYLRFEKAGVKKNATQEFSVVDVSVLALEKNEAPVRFLYTISDSYWTTHSGLENLLSLSFKLVFRVREKQVS